MSTQGELVIIGSGLAGYTVARQVREYQKDRPITLITADGGEVYAKPLLSNALAKAQTPATLVQKTAAAKAEELNIRLLSQCRVEGIDRERQLLETTTGPVPYGDLVLAVGARQRTLVPAGAQPAWLHTVNSLDDYRVWSAQLTGVQRVLLIGAGLIGCEFADDLLSQGIAVDLVDPAPWPLPRLLPEAIGQALADALRDRGATLHLGRTVARLAQQAGRYAAVLDDGTPVLADLVLSAVGLIPNTELARAAGIACNQGILVDRQLRTSDPHIYALGDCAETEAGCLPYIQPLMLQARVLGQTLAGQAARLAMKALPVLVKTTSLPLLVCPPKPGLAGDWRLEGQGRDLAAVFYDTTGNTAGFALSGTLLDRKVALTKHMPPLLAD